MKKWNVFDAHVVVGRHLLLKAGGPHTTADLLDELDHCGIAEALVLDSLARENHPDEGNRRVLRVARASPRLHPAWALLPPGAEDEQPAPRDLLGAMRARKVGAVWLLPAQYRYNLSAWCLDELLGPLAEARVPVFVCYDEIARHAPRQDQTDWPAVVELCRRFPDLPLIASEWRIRRSQRLIYRALDACPNLRLELSGYFLHRGIEYVTRRWSASRLLFGSNWPVFGHGQTLAPLLRAEISDADKRLIAGDNLRCLLRWCGLKHPAVRPATPADRFVAMGRGAPAPRGARFWDCHGHIGGRACHYHLPDAGLRSTVAEMDRQGVEKVCVFSFAGVFSDEVHGNNLVAAAVRRYPDRFLGFTLLNPHRGADAMRRELERGARLGLRGVKLIASYQGYPVEGPLIGLACRWAHERKQIILNHDWGSAEHIERLTAQYPGACFITGHTAKPLFASVRKRENLFVCSCPLWEGPRDCEEVVAEIGAEKLLFGSDLQDLPIAWGLGPILFARLPVADKQLILGGNLRRILRCWSLTA
ncbi:MAG: amidohydrolase family protein [Planctomycetota bacterium]